MLDSSGDLPTPIRSSVLLDGPEPTPIAFALTRLSDRALSVWLACLSSAIDLIADGDTLDAIVPLSWLEAQCEAAFRERERRTGANS